MDAATPQDIKMINAYLQFLHENSAAKYQCSLEAAYNRKINQRKVGRKLKAKLGIAKKDKKVTPKILKMREIRDNYLASQGVSAKEITPEDVPLEDVSFQVLPFDP